MAGEVYIDFSATGQKLERADEKTVAAGAANALYCRFGLNDAWDYYAHVFARFRRGGAVYDVEVVNGVACVPWEVCQYSGFEVALHGHASASGSSTFENNRLTTNAVLVDVVQTIDAQGVEPIGYTPTLMDMLLREADGAQAAAREVQEQAAAGAFTGTVAIGSVTTGAPGTDATVSNSGTPQAAVLDFTIPRGDTGAPGSAGTVNIRDITSELTASNTVITSAMAYSVGRIVLVVMTARTGYSSAANEGFAFVKPNNNTLKPVNTIQATARIVTSSNTSLIGGVQLVSGNGFWSYVFPDAVSSGTNFTFSAMFISQEEYTG